METVAGVFGWHRGEVEEAHKTQNELSKHLEAIQESFLPWAHSPSPAPLIISTHGEQSRGVATFGPTKLNSLLARDPSVFPAFSEVVGMEVRGGYRFKKLGSWFPCQHTA